jgi:hypothetical protein
VPYRTQDRALTLTSPRRYFKNGVTAAPLCGFGIDLDPVLDTWELDVSACGLDSLEAWREPYSDLEVLDLSDNELSELPGWLGEGRMGKLRELRASGNKLETFGVTDWGGRSEGRTRRRWWWISGTTRSRSCRTR